MTTENDNREAAWKAQQASWARNSGEGAYEPDTKEVFDSGWLAALSSRPSPATDEEREEAVCLAMDMRDGLYAEKGWTLPEHPWDWKDDDHYVILARIALASRPSSTPTPATEKHYGHLFDSTCPACQETISKFIQRVEASGLGTTGAKALRSTIDDAHAAEVVARSLAPAADDHAALIAEAKRSVEWEANMEYEGGQSKLLARLVAALEGQGQK